MSDNRLYTSDPALACTHPDQDSCNNYCSRCGASLMEVRREQRRSEKDEWEKMKADRYPQPHVVIG